MYRRIMASLLASATLLSVAACGSAETTEENTSVAVVTEETEAAVTGRDAVSDDLPEKDYQGKNFNIFTRTTYDYEFAVESETGEIMNDTVYNRNVTVEERFNVKITTLPMDCAWGATATAWNEALSTSVLAGTGAYDLVAGYAATIPATVSTGIYYNWQELPYVDFSKPWWSENVAQELTINNKTFMAAGDASLALWEGMT